MQFEETFDFDCSAATLIQMFSSGEFYREKYRRMDSQAPEFLDSELADGQFSIRMRHELKASELSLPDFIGKRIGDHLDLYQTDSWNIETYTGRTELRLHSDLLATEIELKLFERTIGAQLILAFTIHAHIAMFGRKLEQAAAKAMASRMHSELEETARMASERI